LIFLESFTAPALVLRIGEHRIKMPVDWQVLIGEPDLGDLEVLPLTAINDRGFKVLFYATACGIRAIASALFGQLAVRLFWGMRVLVCVGCSV
jgi:hypothetical protein